jgi:ArsR family transcriptional regulator, arsenate/arsenite/antimonite-responsive transcriptional repressor
MQPPSTSAAADLCCASQPTAPPAPTETQVVTRLKALADETRLRMLALLNQQGAPLCVCEITPHFALSQPTVSHHLRLLREADLIRGEKHGTWMYYSTTDAGRRCMSLLSNFG